MSEDVSATMRVGITVILVAALVATVLNLMVMSNSILNGGQTTLQSGIDSVATQEFAPYDNVKVSGTQVNTALSLFQGRDVAIVIRTKALEKLLMGKTTTGGDGYVINYGALLCPGLTDGNKPIMVGTTNGQGATIANDGGYGTSPGFDADKAKTIYGNNGAALFCGMTDGNSKTGIIRQNAGDPFYEGLLYTRSGMVDTSYNIVGATTIGNPQYLLSSARFESVLIKDSTGAIIGIYFRQVA